jgi:hypothetical protein
MLHAQGIRFFTNQPDNKPTSSRSGDSLDSYQIGVQEDEVKRYQGEVGVHLKAKD